MAVREDACLPGTDIEHWNRMYRHVYPAAGPALDEHDRAVGAILIGEALIASCERAVTAIRLPEGPDRWRALRDLHDELPEVWGHLDRARSELAARGINVAGYDELRPHVRTRLATADDDQPTIDVTPLDDVRRACGELKLAVPGAEWAAIEARTNGLVAAPLIRHRRNRLAITAVISVVGLAMIAWLFAIVPGHRPDPRAAMRRELHDIASQRRVRIVMLQTTLGDRCDAPAAHELTKMLVMDGRPDDAMEFADRYEGHCGDDAVVEHWVNAPRPR